jgi:hypothetical protein
MTRLKSSINEDRAIQDFSIQVESNKIPASQKRDLLISVHAFKWTRFAAIFLSLVWAGIFAYLEATALDYAALSKIVLGHFTIENVMLFFIATILGLLPFVTTIRFGDSSISKKSLIAVFQIICISILAEDVSYFVILRHAILPNDWTAQFLGGLFVPFTTLFIPTWYIIISVLIVLSQYWISRL